jgi:hypothetical protein
MKVFKIVLVAGVIIVVAAVVFLFSSLDSLVEAGIEKAGTEATQTRVEVGSVKLTLASGEGTISNLQVDSPAGFSRKQIFTLGEITVAVDPSTVTEKVVVIDKVIIKAPQIFYEINDKGDSNLDALKKNVQEATAKLGSSDKAASGGDEIKLIIRKLVIEGAEVDARIAALGGKDISANLPRIQLNDIGKSSGGATAGEIAEKVTKILISKTTKAITEMGMQQYLGTSAAEAKAKLQEKAKGAITDKLGDQLGGKLKGLF